MSEQADVIIKIRTDLIGQEKVLAQAKKDLGKISNVYGVKYRYAADAVAEAQQSVWKSQQKLNMALGGFKGKMLMASLSMLFFGQTLQRVFNSLWQSGSKTFNEVMHSVEGTVTGFDELNGATTYFGFTIGQALAPIAAWLAPIILSISEWISQNQGLTAGLLVTIGTVGTLLYTLGTIGSALTGFKSLTELLNGASASGLLENGVKIGASIYLAQDTIKDIQKGDFFDAAGNAIFAAGLYAKDSKTKGALLLIGAGLNITQALINGTLGTKEQVRDLLISASGGLFMINPLLGAAALAIAIAINLIPDSTWDTTLAGAKIVALNIKIAFLETIKEISKQFQSFISGLGPIATMMGIKTKIDTSSIDRAINSAKLEQLAIYGENANKYGKDTPNNVDYSTNTYNIVVNNPGKDFIDMIARTR
jgi:hypothetical protein